MKRFAALLLCLLFGLTGCSALASVLPTEPVQTAPQVRALTVQEQAEWLMNRSGQWMEEEPADDERWYYAFTDLNHNGRMEVFAAITEGTGIFTTGTLYEISEDWQSLVTRSVPETYNLPEVIVSRADCFEAGGQYYYCFTDTTRNGAAESLATKMWLSLGQDAIQLDSLAWCEYRYDGQTGAEQVTCSDSGGTISMEAYADAFELAGDGMTRRRVSLDWRTRSGYAAWEDALDSYSTFLGERRTERDPQWTMSFYLEGTLEQVPSALHTGEGYSVYIPSKGWNSATAQVAGEFADIWQSIYNGAISMEIIRLDGMTVPQARSWARQQNPDYTLTVNELGTLFGTDALGLNVAEIRIVGAERSTFVIILRYPMEASEGGGVRLSVMADSFELS